MPRADFLTTVGPGVQQGGFHVSCNDSCIKHTNGGAGGWGLLAGFRRTAHLQVALVGRHFGGRAKVGRQVGREGASQQVARQLGRHLGGFQAVGQLPHLMFSQVQRFRVWDFVGLWFQGAKVGQVRAQAGPCSRTVVLWRV